jgi:hypothetical protein
LCNCVWQQLETKFNASNVSGASKLPTYLEEGLFTEGMCGKMWWDFCFPMITVDEQVILTPDELHQYMHLLDITEGDLNPCPRGGIDYVIFSSL